MLATKRSGNIACGAFLAVLGLGTVWASTSIGEGAGDQLHPRTFPMLIGALLFLGGGTLAVSALMGRTTQKPIDWPDRKGWKLWTIALASLILYVGLSLPLGFIVCSFLFVFGFIWYFGRYSLPMAVAWALGVSVFIYVVFVCLLDLTLPMGPLAFLS